MSTRPNNSVGQIQEDWASAEEETPLLNSASLGRSLAKQKRRWRACYCLLGIALLMLLALAIVAVAATLLAEGLMSPPSCATNCTMTIVESIPENLTYTNSSISQLSTFESWHRLLHIANFTVDIASYYWTLNGTGNISDSTDKQGKQIYQDLIDTHKRGVVIRIVQNIPSKTFPDEDTKALLDMGVIQLHTINVSHLVGSGILHTKLWIIDGRHFYVGSANMDWRSLTQVKELGVMGLSCDCLAADAQKLFNVYWSLSASPSDTSKPNLPSHWQYRYSAFFDMDNPAAVRVNKTMAEVYWASSPPQFCPQGRTPDLTALLHVINSAQKFVNIAVMDYIPAIVYSYPNRFWPDIDDALRRAVFERGVHVRLLGSCWGDTSHDMIQFMRSLSYVNSTGEHKGIMEAKFFVVPKLINKTIDHTRVNHNKYMVTDNSAYVGTSNWSGDYFESTGGVSLLVNQTASVGNSTTVQEQLVAIFNRDWASPYTHNLTDSTLPCMAGNSS